MKNKIAIWAPLRYTNYGDDLQAIVFAKYIQSLGYEVILYQLDEELSKEFNLTSVDTVDELCNDVKLCIIAGGALLTPFHLIKRILNKSAAEYETDFKNLNLAIQKYKTKFCAISMGGDGELRDPKKYYSKHRINFFKSPNFIEGTVRLKGDVEQMKKFGKNFIYIPDCLLQTPKFLKLDIPSSKNKVTKIGLNFKKGKYLSQELLKSIVNYTENNSDIKFYFTTTHMEKAGINYEFLPHETSKNIEICKYKSPKQLLEFISGLDLLVTSKLHLGITGLTVGTPFLSYRGPGKAKSFLEAIGGKWAITDNSITFEELKSNFFSKTKKELFEQFDIEKLNEMKLKSYNQFLFCKEIIEKYS